MTPPSLHIKMLEILMKMIQGRWVHIYSSTDCSEKLDKLPKITTVTDLQNSE